MKKVIAVLLIIVGVIFIVNNLSGSGFLGGEAKDVNEHRVFAAGAIQTINIEGSSVDIKLEEGSSQEEVVVSLTGKASSKYKLTTELDGDVLNIEYKQKWSLFSFDFDHKTELKVELPKKQWDMLDARVSSGNIHAEKLITDKASFKSSSGNIKVSMLEADQASVEASSGNITVEQFTTEVLKTKISSGNTKLLQGRGGVEAKSSSGNIIVDMVLIERDIELKGSSGNIELTTAEEPANADLQLRTSSGRLTLQWNGFESQNMNDNSFAGVIGTGEIKVEATTSSGNIKLLK